VYTALIQARTSSKRLPGKVVKKILNNEVFIIVYKRVLKSKLINRAVILTSTSKSDDKIVSLCKNKKIPFFRGNLKNVIKRFYLASKKLKLKDVVRITADCPLIDPDIIDKVCKVYSKKKFDYVSNTIKPSYPDGLDVEIFNFYTLEETYKKNLSTQEKEHVTIGMHKNPKIIKKNIKNKKNLSNYRFTLDTEKDYVQINNIFKKYKSIYKPKLKSLEDAININKNEYKFIRKLNK
jgi:spore coat polysaccharide biosynthesis protein SpsF